MDKAAVIFGIQAKYSAKLYFSVPGSKEPRYRLSWHIITLISIINMECLVQKAERLISIVSKGQSSALNCLISSNSLEIKRRTTGFYFGKTLFSLLINELSGASNQCSAHRNVCNAVLYLSMDNPFYHFVWPSD